MAAAILDFENYHLRHSILIFVAGSMLGLFEVSINIERLSSYEHCPLLPLTPSSTTAAAASTMHQLRALPFLD